jgi:membrane fusion protein, multidrug efflux system
MMARSNAHSLLLLVCGCVSGLVVGGVWLGDLGRAGASAMTRAIEGANFASKTHRATRVMAWNARSGEPKADSSPLPLEQTSISDGSRVRGIIRAVETATISAELNARILALPFRDGDRFKEGDLLVAFDCAKLVADHEAATAAYKAHELAYQNQLQLSRYKAAGSFAVEQSRYEAEKAKAEVSGLKSRRESCKIAAPFGGRVVERPANAHEIAQPNQPLLKIVNDSRLELVLMVPSSWLGSVRVGTEFLFHVDETGETLPAAVTQIGGAIEPVSQSIRIVGQVNDPKALVLPGMSGTAALSLGAGKQ